MNILIVVGSLAIWPRHDFKSGEDYIRLASPGSAMMGRGYERIVISAEAQAQIQHDPMAKAWFECSVLTRLLPGGVIT